MAAIYYCPQSQYTPLANLPLDTLLDDEEQARLHRMRDEVGARFAQARWMAKSLLAQRLNTPLESIRFHYSDNGKPQLAAHQAHVHFSISHCDDAVAVALGDNPIGVDVEQIERRRGKLEPPWQNPAVFMHDHTAQWVTQAAPDLKPQVFTLLWTLLESQVKVTDSSIVVASRHLQIDLAAHSEPWQLAHRPCRDLPAVQWHSYSSWGGSAGKHILSLAQLAQHGDSSVSLFDWATREPVTIAAMARSKL